MKTLFLVLAIGLTLASQAQTNDYLASTAGIGPIKIGMSKTAVEKLVGTKLKTPKYSKEYDSYDWDTVKCRYKDLDLEIVFSKSYFGTDTTAKLGVYNVTSRSSVIKTKSGIAIGDDKFKIFKIYDQYRMEFVPDYEKTPGPKKSQINLYDNESSNVLIFYLQDGIVTGFAAAIFEGC